jgi:hypothetical protein
MFRSQEPGVLLVREPIKVETGFITKPQDSTNGGEQLHKLKKVLTEFTSPLLVNCIEYLYHFDFVTIKCQILLHVGVC